MPTITLNDKQVKIENLTTVEAYRAGYLTRAEHDAQHAWQEAAPQDRRNNTLVYINGEYKGVARRTTPLHHIITMFLK